MIQYLYILWNDQISIVITIHNYKVFSCDENFFFFVMRTFKIYFLNNFQIYNMVLLTVVSMLYITTQDLLYNWRFVPFDFFHPFYPPPYLYPSASDNLQSTLYEFNFFFQIMPISEIIVFIFLCWLIWHTIMP